MQAHRGAQYRNAQFHVYTHMHEVFICSVNVNVCVCVSFREGLPGIQLCDFGVLRFQVVVQ